MRDQEPIVVPEALAGERLDRAVSLLTGWSRAEVQHLITDEEVLVGGQPALKSHRLVAGEIVELLGAPTPPELPGPESMPLDLRYEDDDVVVLAKPPGLVVHPGPGHAHGTLVHGLLDRYPEIVMVGDPARPGIVHRLDRDTSGLMVVARTERAADALIEALAARDVERRYLALVAGTFEAPRGVVDAPIGRSTRQRTRMAVREAGRPARTGYEVRTAWADPEVSLVECRLETGRTHQIRVHLAAIGHPVVADAAYGGRRLPQGPERPFLHAHALAFAHPVTGERLAFEDPLPPDLAEALTALGPPGE
jgi:23S rRNA pseudouridine1911/1915/1917 synthase